MSLRTRFITLLVMPLSLLAACSSTYHSLLFRLVPHPQEPKERPYVIQEVELTNPRDGTKIAGELTYPSTGDDFPAFVLISGHEAGAPPATRNYEITGHKYFLVISDLLTKRGYAVLRFDNRGVGKSSGTYRTATDDDFASDAAAALEWLRNNSDVRISFSGYFGHSQGSGKALIASVLEEPDYVIALAGLSVEPLKDTLIRQNRDINTASGLDPTKVDQINQNLSDIIDILLASTDLNEVKSRIRVYANSAGIDNEKEVQKIINLFATNWWFKEVRRDSRALLKSYHGPVLGLFGSKDLLVSSSATEAPVRELLPNNESEVLTFEGLNHIFQVANKGTGPNEYWEIETTIEEIVIDKVDVWTKMIIENKRSWAGH